VVVCYSPHPNAFPAPSQLRNEYAKHQGLTRSQATADVLFDMKVAKHQREERIVDLERKKLELQRQTVMFNAALDAATYDQNNTHHDQNLEQANNHHDQNLEQADNHHKEILEHDYLKVQKEEARTTIAAKTKLCSSFGSILVISTLALLLKYHKEKFLADHCSYTTKITFSLQTALSFLGSWSDYVNCALGDLQLVAVVGGIALLFLICNEKVLQGVVLPLLAIVCLEPAYQSTVNLTVFLALLAIVGYPNLMVFFNNWKFTKDIVASKCADKLLEKQQTYEDAVDQSIIHEMVFGTLGFLFFLAFVNYPGV
jgi:hypothetical protein